jgi:V8-like Glu-specific endopeptidase
MLPVRQIFTLGVSLALLAVACDPLATESADEGGDDLVNGNVDNVAHPEIGLLYSGGGRCTATLIAPDIIITAAHCVAQKTCDEPNCEMNAAFKIGESTYVVGRVRSFPTTLRTDYSDDDVAIAQLTTAVPSSIARPKAVTNQYPRSGTKTAVFGYGCTDRCRPGQPPDDPTRGRVDTRWGELTKASCPGDSGGPTLDWNGHVLRVTSGFDDKTWIDAFGDVVRFADAIRDQVAEWQTKGPASVGKGGIVNCSKITSCGDCTERLGCGWCASKKKCVRGNALAPTDAIAEILHCGVDEWEFLPNQCTTGPLPVKAGPPVADCTAASDCGSCAAQEGCVWCAGNNACLPGTWRGPATKNACPGNKWQVSPQCCGK